jgi:hypothetical protein
MFDRLIGRKKKDWLGADRPEHGHRPHPKPFPEGVSCGAGCGKTEGYRCAYMDSTGKRCKYWCRDHSVFSKGRSWCQRHANSVRWLHARSGSIYEIGHGAAIDDRSPNLVGTLVDELDADITAHLVSCFGGQHGVHIVTDGNIRASSIPKGRVEHTPAGPRVLSEGGIRAWDRGWGVYSNAGYLARVVLRVTASEPPAVHVFVNGSRILSRVPDWIANRAQGNDGRQDHANFREAVLQAVQNAMIVEDPDSGS